MRKKIINEKSAEKATLQKPDALSAYEEIRGEDLLETHPIKQDDGIIRFCRMQDFVLFAYADGEKQDRMIRNWKKNANRKRGGSNPHAQAIKATRQSIIDGNKDSAYKERSILRNELAGLDEKKKRNTQKSIDDLTKFIEYFQEDVIRTPRVRDHRPLRKHQNVLRWNNISLTFNAQYVTVFHANHEGRSCFGGVSLHVTDTTPYHTEQREMMAYLMQLLLESNFKGENDEVVPEFCFTVDVPGKDSVQSPLNSSRINLKMKKAADEFVKLWDSIPESV